MVGSDGFVVDRISHDRHEGGTQLLPGRRNIIVGYEYITYIRTQHITKISQKRKITQNTPLSELSQTLGAYLTISDVIFSILLLILGIGDCHIRALFWWQLVGL